jgi:hypothetical protein
VVETYGADWTPGNRGFLSPPKYGEVVKILSSWFIHVYTTFPCISGHLGRSIIGFTSLYRSRVANKAPPANSAERCRAPQGSLCGNGADRLFE